jgi:hypothetical protein
MTQPQSMVERARDYATWATSQRIYVHCHLASALNGIISVILALRVAIGALTPGYAVLIVPTACLAGMLAAAMRIEWIDHLIDREIDAALAEQSPAQANPENGIVRGEGA